MKCDIARWCVRPWRFLMFMLCRPKEKNCRGLLKANYYIICYEYFCCLSHISGMIDQPEINMHLNDCEKEILIIV
jgi:hypothetical protein